MLQKLSHRQWIILLLFLGAVLRLALIGQDSLWLDEAYSVNITTRSQAEIWQGQDPRHPPLYYSLLDAWIGMFGDGETAVRLPSALASLAGLGLCYVLGRRLGGRRLGLIALGLLAFSPLDVWYATEARMYIFVTAAALLMALGWSLANAPGALLAAVGFGLGLYVDYTMIPLWVGVSGVWAVWWWTGGGGREENRSVAAFLVWLGSSLAGWAAFWPWREQLLRYVSGFNTIHVVSRVREILGIPELAPSQFLFLLGLGFIGAALGAGILWRLWKRPSRRRWLALLLVAGFVLALPLLAWPRLYTIKRVLATGWPFAVLLVAAALLVLPRWRQIWYGIMAASLVASVIMTAAVPKDDWRAVAAYLDAHAAAEDVIWIDPPYNRLPYQYNDPLYEAEGGRANALPDAAPETADLWLVAERYPGQPIPPWPSEKWLDENMELVEKEEFYRLEVRRYRQPAEEGHSGEGPSREGETGDQ